MLVSVQFPGVVTYWMLHQLYLFPSVFLSFLPLVVDSGHSPSIRRTKSSLLLPEHERRTHFNKFLVDSTLFPHTVTYKPFKQQPESLVVKICLAISGEGVDFKSLFNYTLKGPHTMGSHYAEWNPCIPPIFVLKLPSSSFGVTQKDWQLQFAVFKTYRVRCL